MRNSLKIAALAATVSTIALATPALAELEIFINIGGTVYTCMASAACNTSGLPDEITLATTTVNGVTIQGEEALSTAAPNEDSLQNSVLIVTNDTGAAKAVTVVVSQTGYTGPIASYSASGGATFNFSSGSTLGLSFYADAADGQGAIPGGVTPGTNLASALLGPVGGGSQSVSLSNVSGAFSAVGPVSMTEKAFYTLAGHGMVTNRGMAEDLFAVPEPSTWAMMVIGFMGLGYAAFRRSSKARAIAV